MHAPQYQQRIGLVHTFTQFRTSIFVVFSKYVTETSFVLILPHVATSMDTIFTAMLNFLDVLKQKSQPYGALWVGDGVYCISKELQILKPELFASLFTGMGSFYMEKIVIACPVTACLGKYLGKYLGFSVVDIALLQSGVFGPEVVKN